MGLPCTGYQQRAKLRSVQSAFQIERVIGENNENKRYRMGRSNNGRGPLLGSPAPDNQGCVSLVADGILKCVKGERNG